jgi:hypothetical protein
MQARTCCSVRGFSRPPGLAGSALSSLATVIDRMSRLRRPFLDDCYLFATVNLLSNLEEHYFGRLAISVACGKARVCANTTLLRECARQWRSRGAAADRSHGASCRLLSGSPRPTYLGQRETFAPRFRDGIPEFPRGVDPQLNGFVSVCERHFLVLPWAMQPGKFRDLRNENLVLIAPIDDDLVFVHVYSFPPSRPQRRTTWRA